MRITGFTMVELLIVAMLLAMLAGIVLPQFGSSTEELSEASLRANLDSIRSAISRYETQHGHYPGVMKSVGNVCAGGTKGTGERETEAAVIEQLTLYSNLIGRVCTLPVGGGGVRFVFGPYLQSSTFPVNPITGSGAIVIVSRANALAGSLSMSADVAGGGWKYDVVSGRFLANDTGVDSRGMPFDQY